MLHVATPTHMAASSYSINILSGDIAHLEQNETKDLQGSPTDNQPCDFVDLLFEPATRILNVLSWDTAPLEQH